MKSRIICSSVRYTSSFKRISPHHSDSCIGKRSLSDRATESGSHNISPMHHVSAMDRISLILTKTMKPPIPSEVPAATMEMANSRRRIGVNLIMGTVFLVGAIWIIKMSQKGRKERTLVSLHERNVQRYEKVKDAASVEGDNNKKSS